MADNPSARDINLSYRVEGVLYKISSVVGTLENVARQLRCNDVFCGIGSENCANTLSEVADDYRELYNTLANVAARLRE